MNARLFIRLSSLSEVIATARVIRCLRTMLPMLFLASAIGAWSQVPGSAAGVPFPPNMPPEAMKGAPGQAVPGSPGASQQQQRAQMAVNAAAATRAQTPQPSLSTASYTCVLIDVANATFVELNAINSAGVVAGYYDDATYNSHRFILQNGTLQTIDYPSALNTESSGINDHGVVRDTSTQMPATTLTR